MILADSSNPFPPAIFPQRRLIAREVLTGFKAWFSRSHLVPVAIKPNPMVSSIDRVTRFNS